MKISEEGTGFAYDIHANIRLTARELRILKRASDLHYDYKCQNIFTPGPDAFGNALRHFYFKNGEDIADDALDPKEVPDEAVSRAYKASWDHLDLMLKVLEAARHDEGMAAEATTMSMNIRGILHSIEKEQRRVGDRIPANNLPTERMELRCGMSHDTNVVVTLVYTETIGDDEYDVLHVSEPESRERDFIFKRKQGTHGWNWWRSREGEPHWPTGRYVELEVAG